MLARLGSGLALAAVAALALVGCSPPEPVATDEDLLAEATASLNSFYTVAEQQFERGEARPDDFSGIATDSFADEYSAQIQDILDTGATSRGVPSVSAIELTGRDTSSARFIVCLDATSVETVRSDGEQLTGQAVAWDAEFELAPDTAELLLSNIEVATDQSPCNL
ncbi:hypothetical protein [Agrococcus sp. SCSIO52902]|uniref:hypothetical protein n=1 Tax=Agrococcus sp. SCSIO52902 TaxID=2933290 RepID=UPI001FF15B78|nr:hypothetical protein [Agrococcus sp. SCSIO52902]UOW01827.1 hypothetical protein MU522_05360 [Agrococcus sp. SCSIO52902]